jgi:hypothetical protein
MLIDETDTDFATNAGVGALVERRRAGRREFDNPHLVRVLRESCLAQAIDQDDPGSEDRVAGQRRPWFGFVLLASLGFWYLVLRLCL